MKQSRIFLLLSLLMLVLLGGAGFAYSALSRQTVPETIPENLSETVPALQEETNLPEAETAPDFVFLNADGEEIRFSDLTGTPLILNFWATWCPPCCGELPYFEKAYAQYGGQVQFLMLNVTDGVRDTIASAGKFYEDNGYTFPVFFDAKGEGSRAYRLLSIPLTVFVNASGEITYQHIGAITEEELFSVLERYSNPDS